MARFDLIEMDRRERKRQELEREHPRCRLCGVRYYPDSGEQWINVNIPGNAAQHNDMRDCIHALGRIVAQLEELAHYPPMVIG